VPVQLLEDKAILVPLEALARQGERVVLWWWVSMFSTMEARPRIRIPIRHLNRMGCTQMILQQE
jgi:hypothetical protein